MNKMMKLGVAALALAVAVPAFADEDEDEAIIRAQHGGAVGYTAVSFALASPVALPWGIGRWDVFGLDLGILYADVVKMYGIGIGGLASTTRGDMIGLDVGGLFNYTDKDVYGIRATLGAEICNGTVYGLDAGGFGYHRKVVGADIELVGTMQEEIVGFEASVVGNLTDKESCGLVIAGGINLARVSYGCQIAGIFNQTEELHGCQIGLVNMARECPWGFQIGLINIIMDNKLKVLPIVNAYF